MFASFDQVLCHRVHRIIIANLIDLVLRLVVSLKAVEWIVKLMIRCGLLHLGLAKEIILEAPILIESLKLLLRSAMASLAT